MKASDIMRRPVVAATPTATARTLRSSSSWVSSAGFQLLRVTGAWSGLSPSSI